MVAASDLGDEDQMYIDAAGGTFVLDAGSKLSMIQQLYMLLWSNTPRAQQQVLVYPGLNKARAIGNANWKARGYLNLETARARARAIQFANAKAQGFPNLIKAREVWKAMGNRPRLESTRAKLAELLEKKPGLLTNFKVIKAMISIDKYVYDHSRPAKGPDPVNNSR